jgi:hypothetical protein
MNPPLYRLSEILEPIAVRDHYGQWHLDRDAQTLTLSADSPSGYQYVINLAELNTSGEMLDIRKERHRMRLQVGGDSLEDDLQ